VTHTAAPTIPLVLLALILGLPGVLIIVTAHSLTYVGWLGIYLLSLPIWNFLLPAYSFWHFDDFSWGDTRQTAGEVKGDTSGGGHGASGGEFDSSKITMKRWGEFEQERRLMRNGGPGWGQSTGGGYGSSGTMMSSGGGGGYGAQHGHERKGSQLRYSETEYHDDP